jgi:hypothetical protein
VKWESDTVPVDIEDLLAKRKAKNKLEAAEKFIKERLSSGDEYGEVMYEAAGESGIVARTLRRAHRRRKRSTAAD